MKSIEWIDQLIEAKKLPSDRQAAILLGMTSNAMSQHRKMHVTTLDDKYAYRLEEELGLAHGKIVLDQHAEREKDPNISAMWRKLASTAASIIFALAFCGLGSESKALDISKDYYKSIAYKNIHYTQLVMVLRRAARRLMVYIFRALSGDVAYGF